MDPVNPAEITIPIEGMNCSGCAANVERAIRKLPGVSHVVVNLHDKRADIQYDPSLVGLEQFQTAVQSIGYSVPSTETQTFTTARFTSFKKLTRRG